VCTILSKIDQEFVDGRTLAVLTVSLPSHQLACAGGVGWARPLCVRVDMRARRPLHQGVPGKRDGAFNLKAPPTMPFCALRWLMYDAPWPVWKRDLVVLEYNAMVGDNTFVAASCSVDVPECPSLEPAEIAVRAKLNPSGYMWRQVEPNVIEVRSTRHAGGCRLFALPVASQVRAH